MSEGERGTLKLRLSLFLLIDCPIQLKRNQKVVKALLKIENKTLQDATVWRAVLKMLFLLISSSRFQ